MKELYHTQCKLRRGTSHMTSWLPEKYAKVGKYLKIKEVDSWLVEAIYSKSLSSIVNKHSQSHKKMRAVTDI